VTPYLRVEVESIGFEIQDEDHVGVHIGATFHECARILLELRTALHVLWLLKRFRCPSSKALYTHAASFPWEAVIPVDSYFSISSNVDHPSINNSMYPNLVLKDAIADRMTKQMGRRADSGPDQSRIAIHLYWKGDRAWIYLNMNGRRLADRGYRRIPHTAPMQETLAAAVLLAAGYDGTVPLVNAMCGSGTLAIEAALIAAGRAPGLVRTNFSFMHTLLFDEDAWQAIRANARRRSHAASSAARIVASDIDPRAVEAARRNAQTAGVEQMIEFHRCDFAQTPIPRSPGIVILNPEYGRRLGSQDELEATYARIGDFFKNQCAGWRGYVFTGSRELSKRIGLRARRRIPFINARIECRLLEYDLYHGAAEDASVRVESNGES